MKFIPYMILPLLFSACASHEDQLTQRHKQWNVHKPNEYVIETCNTGFFGGWCYRYVVVQDQVVAEMNYFEYDEDKHWETETDVSELEEPVAAMFQSAQNQVDDLTKLEFNKAWGFIREFYAEVGTEESGEIVKCFTPESHDISNCHSDVVF